MVLAMVAWALVTDVLRHGNSLLPVGVLYRPRAVRAPQFAIVPTDVDERARCQSFGIAV